MCKVKTGERSGRGIPSNKFKLVLQDAHHPSAAERVARLKVGCPDRIKDHRSADAKKHDGDKNLHQACSTGLVRAAHILEIRQVAPIPAVLRLVLTLT